MTLAPEADENRICVQQIKQNIPEKLTRITSGKALLGLISNSYAAYFDHEEGLTDEETELVGGFLQDVQDWADLSGDLGPMQCARAVKSLHDSIVLLEDKGFFVFGASEKQCFEGGKDGPQNWPVRHVSVLRKSNPRVVIENEKN